MVERVARPVSKTGAETLRERLTPYIVRRLTREDDGDPVRAYVELSRLYAELFIELELPEGVRFYFRFPANRVTGAPKLEKRGFKIEALEVVLGRRENRRVKTEEAISVLRHYGLFEGVNPLGATASSNLPL